MPNPQTLPVNDVSDWYDVDKLVILKEMQKRQLSRMDLPTKTIRQIRDRIRLLNDRIVDLKAEVDYSVMDLNEGASI